MLELLRDERETLAEALRTTRVWRHWVRLRALGLAVDGRAVPEIAHELGAGASSVFAWVAQWRTTHDPAALAEGTVPAGMDAASAKADQFRYGTSRLCTLLFTYELNRRLRAAGSRITVTAFDPGLMPGTGLARANNAVGRLAWDHVLPVLRAFPGVNGPDTSGRNLARLVADQALAGVSGEYFEG